MTRYRICRITDAFPPPWSGLGPGPYELSLAQVEMGNELKIITKYQPGCEEVDRIGRLTVHRIKARSFLFELLAIFLFIKLHHKKKFDLIHTHGVSFFLFHLFLRKFIKVPIFMSVHSVRGQQYKLLKRLGLMSIGFREKVDLWKERLCINRCDYFLPVSQGLEDELIGCYEIDKNKTFVIKNGVSRLFLEANRYDQKIEMREDNSMPMTEKILLFVGVLNGRKDVGEIIKAIPEIIRRKVDVRLFIVGMGELKKKYIGMSHELNVNEHVFFVDNVSHEELVGYYAMSDVFILPSCYEGLPKAALEAMAMGLPVICSDIPGHKELITNGENGYLFHPDDTNSLSEKIIELLTNTELAHRMGRKNRVIVEDKYTWQKVAERCQMAYEKALNNWSS